ncbi:hypothetical protein [Methylobacterium nonmethylotrophicum]|uniref:Uncharacterized protein n=1 Tax=Methylobacterium nonmethylotrophicum TaxID=1141884 RepID=A0A4Z0NDT0_9HYPH|nr:hypothetical protein [Methylobacterium nonmethylotrophicum]TGD93719.1 hypothetical protein EU555_33055 [Methylobacterium nonmethylotrophicum]
MIGGDAYKPKLIPAEEIDAAVSAYLTNRAAPTTVTVDGRRIDVIAAVLAQPYTIEVLARADATPMQKRQAVRTAILLAAIG